ncbi:MAG: hypothetical protein WCI67_09010 [Chloroflexales bacterium]
MTTTDLTTDLTAIDRKAGVHTEACAAARAAQAAWDARWPHHCQECGGSGGIGYSYDPSPAGVSLSAGSMMDYEPCDCFAERGVCPRCAGRWPGPLTYLPRYRLARWLEADLVGELYEADRIVRQRWMELVRRTHGPLYGVYAERRLRSATPGYRRIGDLGLIIAALANRLWPGLTDGEHEPSCGWCGWGHGEEAPDVRPAWECYCAEAEAGAGRRCDRCLRIFTDQHPAVAVRAWGTGPVVKIHAICRFSEDQLYVPPPAEVPAAP